MSDEIPETWPLRPSHAAAVAHGLCMALADLIHHQGGPDVSRRAYLQMCGLATAAELFTNEVSHWFGSRMGEDEDSLERLEDRYLEETG